ncbi:MAG: hypothetical protein ACXAC8_14720 [Candidatus Hodarchaeales archaeon]
MTIVKHHETYSKRILNRIFNYSEKKNIKKRKERGQLQDLISELGPVFFGM